MDITCDQDCDMGYIYLKESYSGNYEQFKLKETISQQNIDNTINNIYLQLNRLNWPKKTYRKALNDGDFIEEFQNDLDENGYMKGIELKLTSKKLKEIVDNLEISTFEFANSQFYYIPLARKDEIFSDKNFIYPFSKAEDAYVILSISKQSRYEINKDGGKTNVYAVAYIKAIMFTDKSPYDINYFKNLKIYKASNT
ncbi:hypothetical protein [Halanaerobium hydrogeniformans]|uniref:Uncharacterized protein n=1 Tax=Halanaerobium hydrogeniformans TaxID=656519 RepID=E4RK58_HALHG|nr:hypothetical protein [Halanaerobium hydrogeniformans]ADQ14610.1 hypothetical protein Halsa_1179 [Halanaerobium hydrogeniformans]